MHATRGTKSGRNGRRIRDARYHENRDDRLVKLIEDYTSHYRELSDDRARKLAEDYLAVEEDRVKVRRAYFGDFAKAVPGKKAARFYQIENKMDAVIRYDLAAAIPVLEE